MAKYLYHVRFSDGSVGDINADGCDGYDRYISFYKTTPIGKLHSFNIPYCSLIFWGIKDTMSEAQEL